MFEKAVLINTTMHVDFMHAILHLVSLIITTMYEFSDAVFCSVDADAEISTQSCVLKYMQLQI